MGLIEESLRGTFAAQVAATPSARGRRRHAPSAPASGSDAAGTRSPWPPCRPAVVLGRGRRGRRPLRGRPAGHPRSWGRTTATDPAAAAAGRRARRQPHRPGRRHRHRAAAAWPSRSGSGVSKVDGWSQTWDAGASLAAVWLSTSAGTPRLLAAGDRVAVGRGSYNGPRVAWSDGRPGVVRELRRRRAARQVVHTPAGAGLRSRGDRRHRRPARPTGPDRRCTTCGSRPRATTGRPGPPSEDAFLGESGDRSAYFGVAGTARPAWSRSTRTGLATCAAVVRPRRLRRSTGPTPSPDLQWLAVVGPDRVDVYNLNCVWAQPGSRR